jgi:hypothetical protein
MQRVAGRSRLLQRGASAGLSVGGGSVRRSPLAHSIGSGWAPGLNKSERIARRGSHWSWDGSELRVRASLVRGDNRLDASVEWRNNIRRNRRLFQLRSGKSRGSANNEMATQALDVLR